MKNLVIETTRRVNCALTADEWSLYTTSMRCDDVAIALNAAFNDLVNSGAERGTVEKGMLAVMKVHEDFGASDSEPEWMLQHLLNKIFPKEPV